MSEGITIDKLTAVYIKIRDARSQLKKKFDDEDAELREQQDQIKHALLDYCNEAGVESARTKAGTIYRTVKTRYWTRDWESLYAFVVQNNMPELFEKRLNQGEIKRLLEEDPESVPPGLNSDTEYVINVRKI